MADKDSFADWERKVRAMLPCPDSFDVQEAIATCGLDNPIERLKLLIELTVAHDEASASGAFNDE